MIQIAPVRRAPASRITRSLLKDLPTAISDLKESRPSMLVEYFARAISYFAGRFPLAEANRGRNTWDASLEQECAFAIASAISWPQN